MMLTMSKIQAHKLAEQMMEIALQEAQKAFDKDEVPVGAVVYTDEGNVVATGHNLTRSEQDPTAHAEIVAIRQACKNLAQEKLKGLNLIVTLEPCAMCAGAIASAGIKSLRFGALDTKTGGTLNGARVFAHKQCHHKPEIEEGYKVRETQEILQKFFKLKRT